MPSRDSSQAPREFRVPLALYTFTVTHVWKGEPGRRIDVLTGRGGGDCGVKFVMGQTYAVYTYERAGRYYASICGRNVQLQYAYWELMTKEPIEVYGDSLPEMTFDSLIDLVVSENSIARQRNHLPSV